MTTEDQDLKIAHYVDQQAPVLLILIDKNGIIFHVNHFASRHLGHNLIGEVFKNIPLDFNGSFQLDQVASCSNTAHLLSFNKTGGGFQSYQFYFYTSNNQIMALGHLDVDEIESISNELIAANQELNDLTRQLNLKNRELIRANDTYGHDAGDLVLQAYAELMKSNTRKEDLVTRFGGEKFMILLPFTDILQAYDFSERIRTALSQKNVLGNGRRVTASFGVSRLMPDEGRDAFIKRADMALYQAKTSGRNRTVMAQDQTQTLSNT